MPYLPAIELGRKREYISRLAITLEKHPATIHNTTQNLHKTNDELTVFLLHIIVLLFTLLAVEMYSFPSIFTLH